MISLAAHFVLSVSSEKFNATYSVLYLSLVHIDLLLRRYGCSREVQQSQSMLCKSAVGVRSPLFGSSSYITTRSENKFPEI